MAQTPLGADNRLQTLHRPSIALVKAQYPQETETLEVVTVGGVVAPEQGDYETREQLF